MGFTEIFFYDGLNETLLLQNFFIAIRVPKCFTVKRGGKNKIEQIRNKNFISNSIQLITHKEWIKEHLCRFWVQFCNIFAILV